MSDAMVWYVDIEHAEALADPERAPNFGKVRRQRALVLEDIAGIPCGAILYSDVSLELARLSDWAQNRYSLRVIIGKSSRYPRISSCWRAVKIVRCKLSDPHSAVQKYNFAKFTGLVLITNEQIRYS
jgi:hypothetical protein